MEGKCQTNLSCPLNFKLLKKREKKKKERKEGKDFLLILFR